MSLTDQELIRKARQGDNAAFGLLWARYEAQVLSLCRRYLDGPYRDPATDAHDLANETFIRALHSLDRYQDLSQENRGFSTWLLEIAKRLCLKFLARQRRRHQWQSDSPAYVLEEHVHEETAPIRLIEEREVLRLAAQEINALPDLYRLPFKLSLEEYSHKEIAEMLSISIDSAMQRIHRARRMLQPRVAPLFGIASHAPGKRYPARTGLRAVEQALSEIVGDVRIVNVTLPSGGELQICMRVDRRLTLSEQEFGVRRRQLQRHPRAWKPYLEFAEFCYHGGHWREAREAYRTALARNPACFASALRLGEMLLQEEQAEEAARVFRCALEQSPPPPLEARLRAEQWEAEGDNTQAVDAFHAAIALALTDRANYYGLHRVLGRLSRYTEQLQNLEALREIAPSDLFAYEKAYTPCARLQQWDLARQLMERAVEIDPNHPLALKHLFQVRMNQTRGDLETLALAERLVRLAPDFVESWSELAWIYAELGREEESLAVLQQFLSEHPANAEACAALAWRCHYLHRVEDQALYARRAYALAPQNWHICWTLLQACNQATTVISEGERLRFAEEIAEHFPQDAFLLERLCYFYLAWNREEEALAFAQRLQALQAADPDLERRLADIYRLCRRWQEAAQRYQRLLARPGRRTTAFLASLGEVLMGLQDPAAEAAFSEAEERAQSWQDYQFLVNLYHRCGLYEKAAAWAHYMLSLPSLSPLMRQHVEVLLQRILAHAYP